MAWRRRTFVELRPGLLFVVLAAVWGAYFALLYASHDSFADIMRPLAAIPIITSGLLLGLRGGVATALLNIPIGLYVRLVSHPAPILGEFTEGAFGNFIGLIVGAGAGWAAETIRTYRDQQGELAARTAQLERSEAKLRTTQEAARIGSWEVDLVTGAYTSSPEAARLYGLPESGRNDPAANMASLHPDDRARSEQAIANTVANGTDDIIQRVVLGNGGVRWLRARGELERGPDGAPARVAGYSQDITAIHENEEALAVSEARFRLATQATRDIIWEWDVATNKSFHGEQLAAYGYDVAALSESLEAFAACIHPDDMAKFGTVIQDMLAGSENHLTAEYRFRRADGTYANMLDRAVILRDAAGKAQRVVGAMTDVTAYKLAEARLRVAEERLHDIVDTMNEVFFSADVSDPKAPRTLFMSKAFEAIYGRPSSEAFADPLLWYKCIHPEDRRMADENSAQLFQGGLAPPIEYRIVRPDASVRWVRVVTKAIRDADGRIVRIDGYNRDVTAEHEVKAQAGKVQELQEIAMFKTRFLNNAAHELATPLTPIRLQMATMKALLTPGMDERQRKAVDLLDRNLDRLALLVTDLLDAARLQSGKLRVTPAPLDAVGVVRDVEASLVEKLQVDGVTLSVDVPDRAVLLVADEARLHQVLFNLVHNASKFTPRGGRIALQLAQDKGWTTFSVQDSGIGLTQEQRSRLFQPFVQVHDTTTMRVGGTGLGLYISRSIVEQLGGTLTCTSPGPNLGTTFEVRFPAPGAGHAAA